MMVESITQFMLIPHPPEAGISFARVNAYQVAETDFDPIEAPALPLERGSGRRPRGSKSVSAT